jgi:LmbE family N-acetylglucosaminyl deacetylase
MKDIVNIVISPHPDDVALSAGLYFLDSQKQTVIYNVFNLSKTGIDGTDDTEIRIREESKFAKMIDADVSFLNLMDTNYRGIHWNLSENTLDTAKIYKLSITLSLILQSFQKEFNVYIPMGIGLHQDHLLCYYSMLCALQYDYRNLSKVYFYEDYPYNYNNKVFLASQLLIFKIGNRLPYYGDLDKKLDMLKLYPSQFSQSYLKKLLSQFDSEVIHELGKLEIIENNLCSVDFLASIDGIRLI